MREPSDYYEFYDPSDDEEEMKNAILEEYDDYKHTAAQFFHDLMDVMYDDGIIDMDKLEECFEELSCFFKVPMRVGQIKIERA